jgi:hypothetical protein
MELIQNQGVATTEITKKVDTFLSAANMLNIEVDTHYEAAAQMLLQAKALLKFIEGTFEPAKKKMNEAKNELMRTIKSFTDPLDSAELIIKKKMGAYHARRERERYEEQRRLQEEARKKEEELLLMRAIHTGDDSLLDQPVEVPTVVIEETKVQGISYREIVKYEIIDPMKVPFPEYWVIDDMKIGKVARATNGTVIIPGVRVWKEKVVAASPNRA